MLIPKRLNFHIKFPAKRSNLRDKIFEKIEEDNFLKMLYLQDGRDNNYYVNYAEIYPWGQGGLIIEGRASASPVLGN